MNLSNKSPIFIFGTGSFGRDTAKALQINGYNVRGFISNTETSSDINKLPVYSWKGLQGHADIQVLIAVFNPDHALPLFLKEAENYGYKNVFLPWDYYGHIENNMGWRFWLKGKDFLSIYQKQLDDVIPLLEDDISRDCLSNVFRFRSGNFLDYGKFNHKECQYFNELTLNSKKEITGYLDIGAFHGENLIELETQLPVKMAMLLEPDRHNFKELTKNNKNFTSQSVHLLPVAGSDQNRFVSFNDTGSGSSGIAPNGKDKILCVRLDDVVPSSEKIDFIKMDVEGEELSVLMGAKNLINVNRPTLAISLYHNWDDLWNIPKYLHKTHHGYSLFVRQHMNNSFDLVLYAVPK